MKENVNGCISDHYHGKYEVHLSPMKGHGKLKSDCLRGIIRNKLSSRSLFKRFINKKTLTVKVEVKASYKKQSISKEPTIRKKILKLIQ